jgi:hypothetical protein
MATLADPSFEDPQRPPSRFDHDLHMEEVGMDNCYLCHHSDGTDPQPEMSTEGIPCSDCHYVDAGEDTTSLLQAYHLQCKGCHEKSRKGPLSCGECHVE